MIANNVKRLERCTSAQTHEFKTQRNSGRFRIITQNPNDSVFIEVKLYADSKDFERLNAYKREQQPTSIYDESMIWIEMTEVSSETNRQSNQGRPGNNFIDANGATDSLRGRGLATLLHEGVIALADFYGINNIGSKLNFTNLQVFNSTLNATGDAEKAALATPAAKILEKYGFRVDVNHSYIRPANGDAPRLLRRRINPI